MKRIKFLFLLALFSFIFSIPIMAAPYINLKLTYDGSVHTYNAEEVYLIVNDKNLTGLTMPPIILNGNTLVPAREVLEELGAVVDWKKETEEVYIAYENTLVILKIGSNIAQVNGQNMQMSNPAKIINSKTMIPIRFVAESLGMEVGWDSKTRIASIKERKIIIDEIIQSTTDDFVEQTTINNQDTTYSQNNINNNSYAKTKITSITIPSETEKNFIINADNEISTYNTSVLPDGRLVVDINDAQNLITSDSIIVSHPYVTGVRVGQNQITPTMVTRIVFDLQPNAKYNVNISENKRNIIVSFSENAIRDISFYSDGNADYLKITGETSPSATASLSSDRSQILVDLPFSYYFGSEGTLGYGSIVKNAKYIKYNDNNIKIILDVDSNSDVSYKVNSEGNTTIVSIMKPTLKGIFYDNQTKQIILRKDGLSNINIDSIKHTDDYLNKKYTLSLGSDYSSSFGFGTMDINDNYLSSITVQNNNGTEIIINEKQILAYTVLDDANNIYIKVQLPKEKYKNIVVLDAGHGGHDPGTDGNGLVEKDLTLDIVLKLIDLIEADGTIKAYSSRITDVYPSFDDRTNLANLLGDMFISVHINSTDRNPSANGTEVYYLNPNTTSSGLTSNILAETIQKNLLAYLGSNDRKTKTNNYIVLRQSDIPATLCEIGFITNPNEAAKMGTEEYRFKAAQAIYVSIKELFEKYPTGR